MTLPGDRATQVQSGHRHPSPRHVATGAMVAAILVAMMLNNIDRQMMSLVKPLLDLEFGWSHLDYGRVAAASQLAAALCLPLMGWIVDIVSTRRCFAWGVAAWSLLTAAQSLAVGTWSMMGLRIALTGAEAIGTPAALKAFGSLASRRRRAFALGMFNMAPSIGAMIGPVLVPLLAWSLGWRWAAAIIGSLGLVWLVWWLRVSRAETAQAVPIASPPPPGQLLRHPAVWLLVVAKALTDQLWWIFLYWLPDFFHQRGSGAVGEWASSVTSIYVWAVLGSLAGAFAAARPRTERRFGDALWLAACCGMVAAMLLLATIPALTLDIVACALAIFGHQIISVLIFSEIGGDRFRARTGTITGIAAFASNLLAVGSIAWVGKSIGDGAGYTPTLTALAAAYLVGGTCLIAARSRTPAS